MGGMIGRLKRVVRQWLDGGYFHCAGSTFMITVPHKYLPDFIVQVDDGHGTDDPLSLIIEIKGFRGEAAKEKANTMSSYWVPGVNNLGKFGRWDFAEFTSVFEIDSDFNSLLTSLVHQGEILQAK